MALTTPANASPVKRAYLYRRISDSGSLIGRVDQLASGRITRYTEVIPVLCPSMDVKWGLRTSFCKVIVLEFATSDEVW
jgi:hypothetical protein